MDQLEIAWGVTIFLAGIVASMISFWMIISRKYMTHEEVMELIINSSPYSKESAVIFAHLNHLTESHKAMTAAVENSSIVMNDMRVEVGRLRGALDRVLNANT